MPAGPRIRFVPEGHTIHRHARLQSQDMAGRRLSVSSPQGWASDAAGELDGRRLDRIDAFGKHLLYRFDGAAGALHVHLGLFGRFRRWKDPAPAPRDTTRLRFEGGLRTVDLSGATASTLLDADEEQALLARLGPDPLRSDADPERAYAALGRRRSPVGSALLDQKVIAGLGNVYRAEVLFAHGIDPFTPARDLTADQLEAIWSTSKRMLRAGERSGKIVTVPASESDRPPSRLTGKDRVQVYRRDRCRRCGTGVRSQTIAARTLYWCPKCQPPRSRR